jgi:hypothetical protein
MRVVIPMVDNPINFSGAVRLAYDEAVFLTNAGHEAWVLAPDSSRSQPEHAIHQGVHVPSYPQLQIGVTNSPVREHLVLTIQAHS